MLLPVSTGFTKHLFSILGSKNIDSRLDDSFLNHYSLSHALFFFLGSWPTIVYSRMDLHWPLVSYLDLHLLNMTDPAVGLSQHFSFCQPMEVGLDMLYTNQRPFSM